MRLSPLSQEAGLAPPSHHFHPCSCSGLHCGRRWQCPWPPCCDCPLTPHYTSSYYSSTLGLPSGPEGPQGQAWVCSVTVRFPATSSGPGTQVCTRGMNAWAAPDKTGSGEMGFEGRKRPPSLKVAFNESCGDAKVGGDGSAVLSPLALGGWKRVSGGGRGTTCKGSISRCVMVGGVPRGSCEFVGGFLGWAQKP